MAIHKLNRGDTIRAAKAITAAGVVVGGGLLYATTHTSECGGVSENPQNGVFDLSLKSKRPKAPKHLRRDGAELFRDVASEYGISDSAGLALLTTACECLDRMRAAQRAIVEHGELTLDRYGCPKINPAIGLEKDSRAQFILALKALALDIEPLRDRVGRPGINGFTGGNADAN